MQQLGLGLGSPAPAGFKLRPYQEEALEGIFSQLEFNRSTLLVMATGLGKTAVLSAVAERWKGRVLVLAHRDELIQQGQKSLEKVTGEMVDVEQAQLYASGARVVMGSVQTCRLKHRRNRMGTFDLIIIDEAHHAPAKSYRDILDHWPDAKVLGVTATPDRTDKKAMGKVFDSVAFKMDIADGIEQGYLAPPSKDCMTIVLDEVDLSKVKKSKGDLQAGELDDAMYAGVEGIAQKVIELQPDRQCILFFPGVRTAHFAAERLNAAKPGSAIVIDGKTDPFERKMMVDGFKKGRYQYLCNCMVATEGFDAPAASCVAMCRPTLSRSLAAQMVGRVTRVLPDTVEGIETAEERRAAVAASGKPDFVILDFVGSSKHDLCSPVDVLGGKYTDAEVKAAKRKAKEAGGGDPQQHLDAARRELKAAAEAIAKAQLKIQAQVSRFDPFGVLGVKRDPANHMPGLKFVPPSAAMKDALIASGIHEQDVAKLNKADANKIMATIKARKKAGLATFKQQRLLSKWGVGRKNVSFKNARGAIDYLAGNGWNRKAIDPVELRRLAGDLES